jgi:murein DD-endopeptidase MepM/ murein hydrolase activator NlpD
MFRSLLAIFLLAGIVVAGAAEPAVVTKVSWQPQTLVNGTVCLFTVEIRGTPQKITAKWFDHEIDFSRGSGSTWYSLAGIPYEVKPGTYNLTLSVFMPDGTLLQKVRPVVVHAARYKTSRLTVPQKYVTPDPEALKRIEAEKAIKTVAFAHLIPSPQWSGDFIAPVSTSMSEAYGTSRTLNGKLATVHRGEDFHAPMGTAVHASNSGEVVLARELYYEGNCVVIDHGLGFMTMYMHLSQFNVKEGDKVEKDQVIALSGDTGRATGPHLHLAVRWSGEYLDPAKLIALKLPEHP